MTAIAHIPGPLLVRVGHTTRPSGSLPTTYLPPSKNCRDVVGANPPLRLAPRVIKTIVRGKQDLVGVRTRNIPRPGCDRRGSPLGSWVKRGTAQHKSQVRVPSLGTSIDTLSRAPRGRRAAYGGSYRQLVRAPYEGARRGGHATGGAIWGVLEGGLGGFGTCWRRTGMGRGMGWVGACLGREPKLGSEGGRVDLGGSRWLMLRHGGWLVLTTC